MSTSSDPDRRPILSALSREGHATSPDGDAFAATRHGADLIATLVTALAIARGEPEAVVRTRFGITPTKEKS